MSGFITTPLLITDYYDSLISQLDIYTEETIKEYRDKGLPEKKIINSYLTYYYDKETDEIFDVERIFDPYKIQDYYIYRNDLTKITETSQAEEYMNKVRQKAIDEIRKVQNENLDNYNLNKEKFKVDRKNLTEEKLEEIKIQLFAKRFCFLVERKPLNIRKNWRKNKYGPLFNLHTVITDFYLRESDIDYIRSKIYKMYEKNHETTKLDKRFLIANQVQKYIKGALDVDLNGYEIIHINQKTLFDIRNIEVKFEINELNFDETDLSFDTDIDLSAINSLSLQVQKTRISDLSAFVNLENLHLCSIKLFQWPFQNLRKLMELRIDNCDLSEFDFDSLNSLTSLQMIDIDLDISVSFKIDLSMLINLKLIDLRCSKRKFVNNLELITDSYNQLDQVRLDNTRMDFSKQFDLPEIKCLDISNVNLSQQLSQQSFYDMTSLIKIVLNNTKLTNVDFLDTDRSGNLEILNLSHNQITVLKKGAFIKLKKLKKLDLSFNQIEELVRCVFEGLECLEDLDIRSNGLNVESIDKTVFDELNRLKDLYIRNYKTIGYVDYLKRDGLNVY